MVLGACVSAIAGSLTNTLLVLGGIYVFFGETYAQVIGESFNALLSLIGITIATNGIPEAILAALIAMAAVKPLLAVNKKNRLS